MLNGIAKYRKSVTQTARNYFYEGRVIVNFVPKFVAITTGVGRGKF